MKGLILFFLIISQVSYGQKTCHLRLRIIDETTQENIVNASININSSSKTAIYTKGHFEYILPVGEYQLIIKHITYMDKKIDILLHCDTTIICSMSLANHLLDEVNVHSSRQKRGISGILGGRVELDMEVLKILPKFVGNNDPLKILQLTPGVQTTNEGESGIFVRGGENGQNLIVWNGAPIYNASHLLGTFSIFNTGHIGKFRLLKSNIGAEHGGRLSSIIEVESPEKIPEKLSVSGSIGIISSEATMALPINKKHALYLSARKTYVSLILEPLLRSTLDGKGGDVPYGYEFQDANMTFITNPTSKDKIILNAYWGLDELEVGEPDYDISGDMEWSNLVASLQWKRDISSRIKMQHTLFVSGYKNGMEMSQVDLAFSLPSSILDFGYRNSFKFDIGKHSLKSGVDYINHTVSPQRPKIDMDSTVITGGDGEKLYTHEIGVYLSDNFHLTDNFWIEAGIRYSANLQTGKYDDLTYNSQGVLTDSVHYGRGEKVDFQHGWEPRICLNYTLSHEGLLQFSYNRLYQYVNLVSISGVGLPTDFWIPTSKNITPQRTDNFSIGYFQSLWQNTFELSIEGYYRTMVNQIEYDNAIIDLVNQKYILEQGLLYGDGKAYGAEFMLKYNSERWNAWISYTLGRSKRTFPDIDNGRVFSAKHDRRHDLSLVVSYAHSKKWDFSSVFVYATGNAYTQPLGMHMVGGNPVKEYGYYNGARLPNYHRLDISANYWFFKEKDRESGLNFSIYNVYRKKNPLHVFVVAKKGAEGSNQIFIQKKYKRLFDIIPSISWTFKF